MAGIDYTSKSVSVPQIQFNGGLNTASGPFGLADNESPDLQNVDLDIFGSALQRNGYAALNTVAITGTAASDGLHDFVYTSGANTTRTLLDVTNAKLYKMDDLDGTWDDATNGLTITADNQVDFTNFLNECYMTNGVDAPWYIDATLTATTMTVPTGLTTAKYNAEFNNYLFLANVTVSGTYSVIANEGACAANDSVEVNFNPQPIIEGEPLDLFQCDDGVDTGVFDLTENEDDILGTQDPALFVFKYYQTLVDSQNDTNPIIGPTAHLIVPPSPQTIYVRMEDTSGTCTAFTEFDIYFTVSDPGEITDPFYLCDQDEDGFEPIDLPMEFDTPILNGEDPNQYNISYHTSQSDADNNINPLPTPHLVPVPGQTIYVRLENLDDISCFDTTTIELIVETRPLVNETPDPLIVCDTSI